VVARAAFHDRVDLFGGKERTGDGAPEGLPLICRFSPAFGFDTGFALLNQRRDKLHPAMENPYPRQL
jgi:hypothetical protein